jgi:hypothetical protein
MPLRVVRWKLMAWVNDVTLTSVNGQKASPYYSATESLKIIAQELMPMDIVNAVTPPAENAIN